MRDPMELPSLDYDPIGTAGRARLTATGATSGDIIDIDTIDLSRACDRAGYARRIAAMFPAMPQSDVERALLALAEERLGMRAETPKLLTLTAALNEWQATADTPRIATAFRPLDELTGGGLPLGSLTVLAGRPGAGKSALALQACIGAMLNDPALVALWGLGEMSAERLACRAVAVGSVLLGMDAVSMTRAGKRSPAAVAVADELRRDLGGRLHVVTPLTLDRIEAAVKATGAKLLVVDYLQLVRVDGAADRRQEVDAVVKALRELTLAEGLALVAVSNVGKSVGHDSEAGSIGKESSEIDFAADLLLLSRPGEEDEHGLTSWTWRCVKNRHARPTDIKATFEGKLQLFTAPDAAPWPDFADFGPRAR